MGLNLRVKSKKRLPIRNPQPLVQTETANACWSLDFMSDSLDNRCNAGDIRWKPPYWWQAINRVDAADNINR